MREVVCPKCGARYEQHPLSPENQELCPACRNMASWDEIREALASAAKGKIPGVVNVPPGAASGPRVGA